MEWNELDRIVIYCSKGIDQVGKSSFPLISSLQPPTAAGKQLIYGWENAIVKKMPLSGGNNFSFEGNNFYLLIRSTRLFQGWPLAFDSRHVPMHVVRWRTFPVEVPRPQALNQLAITGHGRSIAGSGGTWPGPIAHLCRDRRCASYYPISFSVPSPLLSLCPCSVIPL